MKLLKRILFISFIIITSIVAAEQAYIIRNPVMLKDNLLFTDNRGSALYTLRDNGIMVLAEGRGIGFHITLSPVSGVIGTKLILDNGMQVPVLIDPVNGKIEYLHEPVPQAGQVSFTNNGVAAWTAGHILHLSDGRSVHLPAYSNTAPVSPAGDFVVSNDHEDHLWLTRINTGDRRRISPVVMSGFYNPVWSPDGKHILFSSLSGVLHIYSMANGSAKELTEGHSPVWKDNETIIFHKILIEKDQMVNSDIYSCNIINGIISPLTHTANVYEMDPSWDNVNNRLIYHTFDKREIHSLKPGSKGNCEILYEIKDDLPIRFYDAPEIKTKGAVYFEIPHVHQVYDPPDWFGAGSAACGGTAAVMCLAYYGTIEPWPTTASRPYPHESLYGRYICDKYYTLLGHYMDRIGYSRGYYGWGAFGYITQNNWYDTKGYMAEFAWKNGMAQKPVDWSPTRSELRQQADLRMPFVLLNSLTTAGHYITVIGYDNPEATTIIVNDPYGNKNSPNYPSYDGTLARYDWPGYNNGYQNLNIVHCFIYFQHAVPTLPDLTVEMYNTLNDTLLTGEIISFELALSNDGDTTSSPTQLVWKLQDNGVNNLGYDIILQQMDIDPVEPGADLYFNYDLKLPDSLISDTYLLSVSVPVDTHFSEIRYENNMISKNIQIVGYPYIYSLSPPDSAVISTTNPVVFAKFRDRSSKVDIDSVSLYMNGMKINELCTWNTREIRRASGPPLEPGIYVMEARVANLAGYESRIKWTFTQTSVSVNPDLLIPAEYTLSVSPNPFNATGTLSFNLPEAGSVSLDIFDLTGRHIVELVREYKTPGSYDVVWNGYSRWGTVVGSGLYIARLTSPAGIKTTRLVMLK